MLVTIIIFIIILGLLVFVHEFGHFIVAKKSGMKVDEFGFGFPPRIAGIQKVNSRWHWVWGHREPMDKEQTVYSINWIPLGGFVKIVGENNEAESDPRSFINRSFFQRFFTLVAGVAMNVILAWVLFSIGLMVGLPVAVDSTSDLPAHATLKDAHIAALEVVPGLSADKAGLKPGDTIYKIDGQEFKTIDEYRNYILENAGKTFDFQIKRGSETQDLQVASLVNPPEGQGPTGIALANVGNMTVPWYFAFYDGAKTLGIQLANIISGLYQLFTGKVGFSSLGGPLKIAQLTGEVSKLGFIYLLQFTAFLSLNLAILNILPFPALDGGRVLFLIIEKIRRKRNNQKVEQIVNTAGFVFLLLLMLFVTVHDVSTFGGAARILHKLVGG